MCSRTLMLTILIVGVVFLSGCPIVSPPFLPVQPGRDQWGCDRPYESVVLNKNQLELAALNVGRFTLGKLDYKRQPELVEIMTKASGDLLVIDYLICVAKNRKDIDANDLEQVNYIRNLLFFMQSKPTADQIMEWQKKNPFPKKQGRLEVSGPFASSNSHKLLVFKNSDIFRKVTIINVGSATMTSWIEEFPMPYFFSELADGHCINISPKADRPFNISRTHINPEKQKLYPFKVKADTKEQIVVNLRVDPNNPGPYDNLKAEFVDALKELERTSSKADKDVLALEAAEKVVGKNFPDEKDAFKEFLAGQLLFVLGFYDASILAYKSAEISDPQIVRNSQYMYFLGISAYFSNRPTEAAKHFTEVSKLAGRPITTITELYKHARALGVPDSVIEKNVWSEVFLPVPESSYQALLNRLPSQLSTATAGRLEIEASSTKLRPQEYFTAVQEGRVDIAALLSSFYYQEVPIINIGGLPGLFKEVKIYRDITDELLFETLGKILEEKYNLVLLATGALPGSLIFSKKSIKTVDDLKGLKVVVDNNDTAKLVGDLGASPARLPHGELYVALQRGVVDASATGSMQGYRSGLFEIAPYAYDWRIGDFMPWVIVASRRAWKSLPSDLQARLRTQFRKTQAEIFTAAVQESQKALGFLKEKGVTIIIPSRDDMAKIRNPDRLNEIYQDWIQLNKQHGIDAEPVLVETKKRVGFK